MSKIGVIHMVQPRVGQGSVQFALRLPVHVRDKLKEAADLSGRSINSEILFRIQQSFTNDEGKENVDLFALPAKAQEALAFVLEEMSKLKATDGPTAFKRPKQAAKDD
jgi:hypothetical protein